MSGDAVREGVDFDLHGIVGVRLIDATPGNVAAVVQQIGPLGAPLHREPDITVRFTDSLSPTETMTYAGWDESGSADGKFHLLKGKGNAVARTILPFDTVGGRCDIVCERRVPAVPHLLAAINFAALAKGILPLHASAFSYDGHGVLATGWAKGGKTETLLAFMGRGAQYVGDEWVYLAPDDVMYGIPEPIRLWHWQAKQLPADTFGLPARGRMAAVSAVAAGVERLAGYAKPARIPASVLRRAAPVVRRQAYVQLPPARLFGASRVVLRGALDRVVLVAAHDAATTRLDAIDPGVVARAMLASLAEERAPFMAHYRQFRYLFPDRRSPVVDAAPAQEKELLAARLGGHDTAYLRHPYPVRIDALFEPVRAWLSRGVG